MLFQRPIALLLAALTSYTSLVAAADPSASTLYLSETETQFSLNIANDSQNVFLHFESPAYSWVAVGFGERMQGSLMFIMYPSSNGQNVTISPRIGTDHAEPVYAPEIQLDVLPGTGITNETFVLNAVCHNCRIWNGGFLPSSSSFPMIYAFGPGNALQSDSHTADLKRHIRYGHFNMDLKTATGAGGVPAFKAANNGVDNVSGMTKDHDRANLAHAVLGCIAIFVLWPLNMIFAGFVKKAGIHVGFSVFTLAVLIISYSVGISVSGEYNRSKAFNSPHQIMAFITILPILLMSILPIRPIFNLSQHMPRIHRSITTLTFVFLVLVGGLGLNLSSQVRPIILVYTVISLFVFAFLFLLQTIIAKRGSRIQRNSHHPSVHSNKSIGSWTSWRSGKWSRKKAVEEDEQDLVLAAYYAGQKSRDHDRSGSVTPDSQRSGSQGNIKDVYGGGQMPGPQYLLNMHPGVPVHFK